MLNRFFFTLRDAGIPVTVTEYLALLAALDARVAVEDVDGFYYLPRAALVKDEKDRVRCVACQLCEFICPPRAIRIVPGEIPSGDRFAKVEKYPEEFDIDMIRCIYCGMCEEVCPEQAIFLRKDYAITGYTREEMVHNKEKLIEIGGVMHGLVLKWNERK